MSEPLSKEKLVEIATEISDKMVQTGTCPGCNGPDMTTLIYWLGGLTFDSRCDCGWHYQCNNLPEFILILGRRQDDDL